MVSQILFSGKLYPNKKFSLGIIPRKKTRKSEREYEKNYAKQPETDYFSLIDWLTAKTNIGGKYCSLNENPVKTTDVLQPAPGYAESEDLLKKMDSVADGDYSNFYESEKILDRPLFIKGSESSQREIKKYGLHGITKYGRNCVENICILLQRRYGRKRLGFATCTLPPVGKETLRTILASWGDIVRRFYQKVKRLFKKRGDEFDYVGVTEIQEKRFVSSGMAVPHLHYVYVSRRTSYGNYTAHVSEVYPLWNDAVNEVLLLHGCKRIMGVNGHKGGVKLESVRSSASAYLGKYISKGCKVVEAMQEKGYEEFPKQWWTASMRCKKIFKASVINISPHTCKSFFYNLDAYVEAGMITWARFVDVCIGGEYRTMGLAGKVSSECYQLLRDERREVV